MTTTEAHWRDFLNDRLALVLDVEPGRVDPARPFVEYGLHAAAAAPLFADLSLMLGRPIVPALLRQHPTIDALARALADGAQPAGAHPGASEPIAIVGLACRRLMAANPGAYWQLLRAGRHRPRRGPAIAGTSTPSTTPTPRPPASCTPAAVTSSSASPTSIRRSSASPRARSCSWIPSSA